MEAVGIVSIVCVAFAAGALCGVAYFDSLMWRADEGSDE